VLSQGKKITRTNAPGIRLAAANLMGVRQFFHPHLGIFIPVHLLQIFPGVIIDFIIRPGVGLLVFFITHQRGAGFFKIINRAFNNWLTLTVFWRIQFYSLFHDIWPCWQGSSGTRLLVSKRRVVIKSHPDTCYQPSIITDEPGIAKIVSSTGFGAGCPLISPPADTHAGAIFSNALHEIGHQPGYSLINNADTFRDVTFQNITIAVLDSAYKYRFHSMTFIGEGSIATDQFIGENHICTHSHRIDSPNWGSYPEIS